jgi:hypothetical protein
MKQLDIIFTEFNERMEKEIPLVAHDYLFAEIAKIAKANNMDTQTIIELYTDWENSQVA